MKAFKVVAFNALPIQYRSQQRLRPPKFARVGNIVIVQAPSLQNCGASKTNRTSNAEAAKLATYKNRTTRTSIFREMLVQISPGRCLTIASGKTGRELSVATSRCTVEPSSSGAAAKAAATDSWVSAARPAAPGCARWRDKCWRQGQAGQREPYEPFYFLGGLDWYALKYWLASGWDCVSDFQIMLLD